MKIFTPDEYEAQVEEMFANGEMTQEQHNELMSTDMFEFYKALYKEYDEAQAKGQEESKEARERCETLLNRAERICKDFILPEDYSKTSTKGL